MSHGLPSLRHTDRMDFGQALTEALSPRGDDSQVEKRLCCKEYYITGPAIEMYAESWKKAVLRLTSIFITFYSPTWKRGENVWWRYGKV